MLVFSVAMSQAELLLLLLAYEGVSLLDITGPLAVFSQPELATASGSGHAYRVVVASRHGGPVATSNGLTILTKPLSSVDELSIDTIVVPGGPAADAPPELVAWLVERAPHVRRICAVCTGAYLLAAAGLLAGRRATTHWLAAPHLKARYPEIKVEADPIFIKDGDIWTSAGVTAGMDMALALIEEDHGHRLAMIVARKLVMFIKRPGGQSQFSIPLMTQSATDNTFADLHAWMANHLHADLTVDRLAARVRMTPRTFARIYAAKLGRTPAKTVEAMRLEAACRALEETDQPIKQIAHMCGFGREQNMRRAFLRRFGIGPIDYRARFSAHTIAGDRAAPARSSLERRSGS